MATSLWIRLQSTDSHDLGVSEERKVVLKGSPCEEPESGRNPSIHFEGEIGFPDLVALFRLLAEADRTTAATLDADGLRASARG